MALIETDAWKKISLGIRNYSDLDVRGVGMMAQGDSGDLHRMVEVPTPAWIPDSFLRAMKRNLYLNMINNGAYYAKTSIEDANDGSCLDFYKESNSGIIGNLINTAVKSIVSTAANQVMSVTSKVDSVVNGVSSLFGGNEGENKSLYRMINETARNPFLASQPYLKINGIHMAENVRDVWDTIESVTKIISVSWENIKKHFTTGESAYEELNKQLMEALKTAGVLPQSTKGNDVASALARTLSQPEYRMHNFAESQLLAGVSGYYTLTCKLPFFGNSAPILQSSGTHAFRTGWGSNAVTEDSNGLIAVARRIGFNVTWNEPVSWSPDRIGSDGFEPVKYAFNIYNDTLEHVLTNLSFIWSFGATTQAVTDYMSIRPPYIYDIEIPGGVRYKYCTCGFRVTPQGKLRKLSSIMQQGEDSNGDVLCSLFKQICGIDVNPNAIAYVPDFYKVEVVFTSLLPNTWNFIDSYLHDGNTVPLTGNRLRHMLSKLVTNFAAFGG